MKEFPIPSLFFSTSTLACWSGQIWLVRIVPPTIAFFKMHKLSLICLLFSFPLSFAFEVKEGTKIKCGDLDSAFWEWMHKYDLCELKKLPKKPQCGEGRKKCGMPGSHCDNGVCSTACGAGKPECPNGFHCENGDCEESEEEYEKYPPIEKNPPDEKNPPIEKSPTVDNKPESQPGPKSTTSTGDVGNVEAESPRSSSCEDEKCKEEEGRRVPLAVDTPPIDVPESQRRRNQTSPSSVKAPQKPKPKNGGFIPNLKGSNKHANGTAKAGSKRPSSRMRPQPQLPAIPINHAQTSPVELGQEIATKGYGLCNVIRGQDAVCKVANETCVRRPRQECESSNPDCVKLADEPGICIGYATSTSFLSLSY